MLTKPAAKNVSSSFCGLPEPNHGNEAFVISIVFGALALFSVALRLAGRRRSPTGQFGLDDAVISLALVSSPVRHSSFIYPDDDTVLRYSNLCSLLVP